MTGGHHQRGVVRLHSGPARLDEDYYLSEENMNASHIPNAFLSTLLTGNLSFHEVQGINCSISSTLRFSIIVEYHLRIFISPI